MELVGERVDSKLNIVDYLDRWVLASESGPDCEGYLSRKKHVLIERGVIRACVYEISDESFDYSVWSWGRPFHGEFTLKSGSCSSLDEAILLSTILYLNNNDDDNTTEELK
jgi:hypothetical protein